MTSALASLLLALGLVTAPSRSRLGNIDPGGALFDQSIVRMLREKFPEATFLLVDVSSGVVIGPQWPDAERPIPVGSLTKPFFAMAAAQDRRFDCKASECWKPGGHGTLGLMEAIAGSCNSYFLQLARPVSLDALRSAASRFGLDPPPVALTAEAAIGLGNNWLISPVHLAQAYLRLQTDPSAGRVRAGMAMSARAGTAKGLGTRALAKTGTAACAHDRGDGDGYVVVMYPENAPKYLLLVQVHNTTGSKAAEKAGEMLRAIHAR